MSPWLQLNNNCACNESTRQLAEGRFVYVHLQDVVVVVTGVCELRMASVSFERGIFDSYYDQYSQLLLYNCRLVMASIVKVLLDSKLDAATKEIEGMI